MIWHFLVVFIEPSSKSLTKTPLHFFYYGEANIIFFFIHSGFILSYSYRSRLESSFIITSIQFLIERVFRILPLFLFVLLVSWFLQHYFWHNEKSHFLTEHSKGFWAIKSSFNDFIKQSILILRPLDQEPKRLIPQDWTLTVELIVGAFLPLLLWTRQKGFHMFAVVYLLLWQFANTYIFEFGLGVLLFFNKTFLMQKWKLMTPSFKILFLILSVSLYTCFFQFGSLFSDYNIAFSFSLDRFFVNMGCLMFFVMLIGSNYLKRLLSQGLFVKLGRICYSLYLWHMLWLIIFAGRVLNFFNQLFETKWLVLPSIFVIYLSSIVFLSVLSFYLIEMPLNIFGKRLGGKIKEYMRGFSSQIL